MLNLSLAATVAKYQMDETNPWYLLMDITMDPNVGPLLRIARADVDVVFQGQTYSAFNFDLDILQDRSTGELPVIQAKITNINRIVEGYLQQYAGGVGAQVSIYVVQAVNLAGEPDLQTTFTVMGATSDSEWVTFTLGADNPLRASVPRFVYLANHCRKKYNTSSMQAANDPSGLDCGYNQQMLGGGLITSCDKTLDGDNGCKAHGNSLRYGGFPGIDALGFRVAQIG